jgi:pilus assembly protein CpaE
VSGTLLVTPDGEFEAQVKRAFDGELDADRFWDDHIPRTQPETAVRQLAQDHPEVVVLGPGLTSPVIIALAEAFDLLHPEVCIVIVAKPSTRLWERALRAGVREIITPGTPDEDVRDALIRAGSAAARRRATSSIIAQEEEAPRGRVIAVMSPKGGAGKTTVATNLAARLALSAPGRVAIIDLDLQFGDVASALGLGPQATIADAARLGNQLDSTALKVFLEPHPSGLYALVGPHFPAEAEEVGSETVGDIIDILAEEFDYVVIDTAAGLDEFALAAAERADDIVLVCVTDVPSVRGLRKALDAIDLLGMTKARRHLVLNRSDDKVGLSAADVEATIGVPVEASVPTSRSIQIAVNQGAPVVQSDPRSPAGKAMSGLAGHFIDQAPAAAAPAAERGRLFSRKDAK